MPTEYVLLSTSLNGEPQTLLFLSGNGADDFRHFCNLYAEVGDNGYALEDPNIDFALCIPTDVVKELDEEVVKKMALKIAEDRGLIDHDEFPMPIIRHAGVRERIFFRYRLAD